MSTSSLFLCQLPAAALVLLLPLSAEALSVRGSFHIYATAARARVVDGVNVSYTLAHDVVLSGYELPGRPGIYNITSVTGTRTYTAAMTLSRR